jgi:hypothetical protein
MKVIPEVKVNLNLSPKLINIFSVMLKHQSYSDVKKVLAYYYHYYLKTPISYREADRILKEQISPKLSLYR